MVYSCHPHTHMPLYRQAIEAFDSAAIQHLCIWGRHAAWSTIWLQRSLHSHAFHTGANLSGMPAACKDDFKSFAVHVIDVCFFLYAACWISLQETCTIHARLFTQPDVRSSLLSCVQQSSDVCIAIYGASDLIKCFADYCTVIPVLLLQIKKRNTTLQYTQTDMACGHDWRKTQPMPFDQTNQALA